MFLPSPIRTPQWITRIYPSFLWGVPSSKAVYLTFDDGPTPEVTLAILSLLKTYQAKATFFCVGNNVSKYPELFKQIVQEGHSWGNHTYQHNDIKKTSKENFIQSIEKCRLVMQEYAQQPSKLFRPPQGRIGYKYNKILDASYQVVFWSLLSMDHKKHISVRACTKNLMRAKAGDILVLHDNKRTKHTTLESLAVFLEWAQKNKLELLGLPMH